MVPGAFQYHLAGSLPEALHMLAEHGEDAKILAGGQSLIPAMRFRLAQPAALIDINGLADLAYLREADGFLEIGALTRETTLEDSELVASRYPLLHDASLVIADPLVRNRATVGGNLAHADPANDHPAVMLAYGAELVARGASGERTIAIDDFFQGLFESALEPGEILTVIRIPQPAAGSGGAYVKLERKVGDYAISAVAVQLVMDGAACRQARIALTNVSPVPTRATDAEAAVAGKALSEEVLEAAGRAAAAQCEPTADLRGSAEYKRDVTRVLTKRALKKAAERAAGGVS
jgi:aerobic carbon-monoxide dehydrogenase medium subunit